MVRPKRRDARWASLRSGTAGNNGNARGKGAVGGDTGNLLNGQDLVAPPTSLMVNPAARISNLCSSIPIWILHQTRRVVLARAPFSVAPHP